MARADLAQSGTIRNNGLRYATAHLAALRAASALLAARATPTEDIADSPTSVWVMLVMVAPELEQWTDTFTASARNRATIEAGGVHTVDGHQADILMIQAGRFVQVVETILGLTRPI
jgi:hypothetical protein